MEKDLRIHNDQWDLSATLHYPPIRDTEEQREVATPAVIICHGFVGNRLGTDRLFVKAARILSDRGFMVMRFDYAGCGESFGEYGEQGLDAMIEQTRMVLDYVSDIEGVDRDQISLVGHSLGGAVALLTAAKDRRVNNLVLWAPVAHPFSDIVSIVGRQVYEDAESRGASDYLGYSLYKSFFASLSRHQPIKEATQFLGDVLLIHGTSDDVIPVDYTFLYQSIFWTRHAGECDKEIILHADHTFSSSYASKIAIERTAEWLHELERKRKSWYGWMI